MGFYEDDERTVHLRSDLVQNQMRSVLAHEVERARLRHRVGLTGAAHRARELRVDRAAALRLMPEVDWRDALSAGEKLAVMDQEQHVQFLADRFRVDRHAVRIRLAMPSPGGA